MYRPSEDLKQVTPWIPVAENAELGERLDVGCTPQTFAEALVVSTGGMQEFGASGSQLPDAVDDVVDGERDMLDAATAVGSEEVVDLPGRTAAVRLQDGERDVFGRVLDDLGEHSLVSHKDVLLIGQLESEDCAIEGNGGLHGTRRHTDGDVVDGTHERAAGSRRLRVTTRPPISDRQEMLRATSSLHEGMADVGERQDGGQNRGSTLVRVPDRLGFGLRPPAQRCVECLDGIRGSQRDVGHSGTVAPHVTNGGVLCREPSRKNKLNCTLAQKNRLLLMHAGIGARVSCDLETQASAHVGDELLSVRDEQFNVINSGQWDHLPPSLRRI